MMNKSLRILAALGVLLGATVFAAAQVPNWPQTLPASTLVGRLAIGPGPAQAIPFAQVFTNWTGIQPANTLYAGPTSGGSAFPTFRAQVIADLPVTNANSLLGNPTGAGAVSTNVAVSGCSGSGNVLIWTTNTGFSCVTVVGSYNSRTGAVTPAAGDYTLNQIYNCTLPPQGRLTFLTGTPVMTTTTSGASSHFYTPYIGQQVPIYDGTRFNCTDTGGELTQTAADTTKSPTAVTTNACYDVFVWSDSGTIRATRGKVWTNVTTRADALQRINGIYTNGTAVTNGPAQNRGTYVGTECSNGSSTFDFIYGASASGGTAASLNVWNQYNRVGVVTAVTDSGTAYTYGSAVIRQARASAGNQVTFVSGNPEDGIEASYVTLNITGATATDGCLIGVGLDSTSTFFGGQAASFTTPTANATTVGLAGTWFVGPQTGRHIISANENDSGITNPCTMDQGTSNILMLKLMM